MYLQHFGMSRMPFGGRPDGAPIFMSPPHAEALATLVYGMVSAKPLIMLTGDVGLGKSTVLGAAIAKVKNPKLRILTLDHPLLQPRDLLRMLGQTLGMSKATQLSLPDVRELHNEMLVAARDGMRLALIIDEAQLLPSVTLEFVRLLSNLEATARGTFCIVIVGQPELWAQLQRPQWRHLKQRIALRAELKPLSRAASADYLRFCLRIADTDVNYVFTSGALRTLVRRGAGVPRRLNFIADNALLYAFGEGQRPVRARHIRAAANMLDGSDGHLYRRAVRRLSLLIGRA
jgi:general secretion pathway protein A